MTLGPVMLDLEGPELTPEEREILCHPLVGGVILFTRNFIDAAQLTRLTAEIHGVRRPPLLVTTDQEGGRVQRFRDGFTALPAVHLLGRQYDLDPADALEAAETLGWMMAAELRAVGVDMSFAPVLDLDRGVSEVVGDRAFHRSPDVVSALARRYIRGMSAAGMTATGKHFPGHGAVTADSVRYTEVDAMPASFSRWWLTDELRGRLGFRGAVFSDDLSMAAAEVVGDAEARARAALAAGCDMILLCNDRAAALALLDALGDYNEPASQVRLARLHGRKSVERDVLVASDQWRRAGERVRHLTDPPPLQLDG